MIQEYGCVISSNYQRTISVDSVYDHFDIPSYPKTSATGIAHFVHFQSPLIQEGASKAEVNKAMNRQMSKVCCAYAKYMPNLTSYRFNSRFAVLILILRICVFLDRITRTKTTKHGMVRGDVLELNIVNILIQKYYVHAQHMMTLS
jgi:hypothetical protein